MAEMYTGVESSAKGTREISPRSARRRRLELQRRHRRSAGQESSVVASNSTSEPRAIDSAVQNPCTGYGFKSILGRRREMEDVVSVHPQFFRKEVEAEDKWDFYGVFDGHGCSHAAASCKDRMHEIVAEVLAGLVSVAPRLSVVEWNEVMERSFHQMDVEAVNFCGIGCASRCKICRCQTRMSICIHVGTTAVVAVVGREDIVVANCGDSRAVLCRSGTPVPLSNDHKPDRPDEQQRIEAVGGRVVYWDGARVLGVLATSRAIGDGYLKPYVTALPEVTVTERSGDDECLILASDGLWDVVTNQEACDIARKYLRCNQPFRGDGDDKGCSDAASHLTRLALAKNSTDNVSVVVVNLKRGKSF